MADVTALPTPRDLYRQQIRHATTDDRDAQMSLYADDCLWEFAFPPPGRPGRMEGRDAIRAAMAPAWQRVREAGIKATVTNEVIHDTLDPEVIVAEFDLD